MYWTAVITAAAAVLHETAKVKQIIPAGMESDVLHKQSRVDNDAKCLSCGSRQFVMHANRRICSYCRSDG